jgi:hypothetical protein
MGRGRSDPGSPKPLRLIIRWAACTDAELRVLERSLDDVEARAHVDCPPFAVEALSDEIGAERSSGAPRRARGPQGGDRLTVREAAPLPSCCAGWVAEQRELRSGDP